MKILASPGTTVASYKNAASALGPKGSGSKGGRRKVTKKLRRKVTKKVNVSKKTRTKRG